MKDLIGKTFTVVALEDYDNNKGVIFKSEDQTYMLVHLQWCCEDIWLEDMVGDLSDLENSEIIKAEKRKAISKEYNEIHKERVEKQQCNNSFEDICWTFYEIATNKGTVTLRFCGPDAYYSTDVDLVEIMANGDYRRIDVE